VSGRFFPDVRSPLTMKKLLCNFILGFHLDQYVLLFFEESRVDTLAVRDLGGV
jgi:hypothetical protein